MIRAFIPLASALLAGSPCNAAANDQMPDLSFRLGLGRWPPARALRPQAGLMHQKSFSAKPPPNTTKKPDFSAMASDLKQRMQTELEGMKRTLREEVEAKQKAKAKTASLWTQAEQKKEAHMRAVKEATSKLNDISEGRRDIQARIAGTNEMAEERRSALETEISELTARNVEMKNNLSDYYRTLPQQIHKLSQEVRGLNASRVSARYLLRTNRTKMAAFAQRADGLERELPHLRDLVEEERQKHSVLVREVGVLNSQIQADLKDTRLASATYREVARREEERKQAAAQKSLALSKRRQSLELLQGEIQGLTRGNEQLRLNYESALAAAKMHGARRRQMSMELTKLQPQLDILKRRRQSLKETAEKERAQIRDDSRPLAARANAAVRSTAAGIMEAFEGVIGELKAHDFAEGV